MENQFDDSSKVRVIASFIVAEVGSLNDDGTIPGQSSANILSTLNEVEMVCSINDVLETPPDNPILNTDLMTETFIPENMNNGKNSNGSNCLEILESVENNDSDILITNKKIPQAADAALGNVIEFRVQKIPANSHDGKGKK